MYKEQNALIREKQGKDGRGWSLRLTAPETVPASQPPRQGMETVSRKRSTFDASGSTGGTQVSARRSGLYQSDLSEDS